MWRKRTDCESNRGAKEMCRAYKSKINHQNNNVTIAGRPDKYSKKQLSEILKMKDRYTIRKLQI
jgi:hypothetical protein